MNLFWITVNPKLKEGIQLLNSLNISKFSLLIQDLVSKDEEFNITDENVQKWQDHIDLEIDKVHLLIQTLLYLLKHSSKIILKPTILQQQLVNDLCMHQDKAEEFVKTWSSLIKEDFTNLESRQKLDDVSWEVNLQTLSSIEEKEVIPHVRMKFALSDENVQVQLNEKELVDLYNSLESMQRKLDHIQRFNKP